MARPRKEEGRPEAKYRIKEALWSSLAEMPFAKVTVNEIAARAGVNRNAFYYHFQDMNDLANLALHDILDTDVMKGLIGAVSSGSLPVEDMLADEDYRRRVDRLCSAVGRNSTPELIEVVEGTVLEAWLSRFGRTRDDLSDQDMIEFMFTIGGILSVLGRYGDADALPLLLKSNSFRMCLAESFALMSEESKDRYRQS